MRVRLTKGYIDRLKPGVRKSGQNEGEPGESFLRDTEVAGLAVRCTPAGAKSFIFQARLRGGGIVYETLGSIADHAIDNPDPDHPGARQWARRMRQLIDQGIDPRVHRADKQKKQAKEKVEEHRKTVTLGAVWERYVEKHKGGWSALHLRDHMRLAQKGGEKRSRSDALTVPGPLAKLMPLRLSELDAPRIAEWAEKEAKTRKTSTRLSMSLLRTCLQWASEEDAYKGVADPTVFQTRAVRRVRPKAQAKDDRLLLAQIKPWFTAVRAEEPVVSTYLQCLLLLGCRREELAALKWSEVDLKWGRVTLHGKTDDRTIPLPPYCAHLIDALPRVPESEDKPTPLWVFASKLSASGYLHDPNRAHSRAFKSAGIPHLTLHGLRRSYTSLAEEDDLNPPAGVVAQLQGHKPSATIEKHYAKRTEEFLRLWSERIEGWILRKGGVRFTPKKKAAKKKSG